MDSTGPAAPVTVMERAERMRGQPAVDSIVQAQPVLGRTSATAVLAAPAGLAAPTDVEAQAQPDAQGQQRVVQEQARQPGHRLLTGAEPVQGLAVLMWAGVVIPVAEVTQDTAVDRSSLKLRERASSNHGSLSDC